MEKTIKKQLNKLFIAILSIVLIATIGFMGCKPLEITQETITPETAAKETVETTEETAAAPVITDEEFIPDEIKGNINILSGLDLSGSILDLRPLAIMVENTPPARPQSGLIYADVIFEVEDEAGITRFVVVYSSREASLVGPVRSTRPYYAEISASFNPIYVFWGTHPKFYQVVEQLGLDYLSPLGDRDGTSKISANFADPGSGEGKDAIRDTSRSAPNNAYVRTPRMREIAQNLGYAMDGGQSSFNFKEDAPENERGTINYITIDFSSPTYKVNFEYDVNENNYKRYIGGALNTDRETGETVSPNNIVVLFTDIVNSGSPEGHMIIRTTQSGKAHYFMDGKVIEGTWERYSALDPFHFKDDNGKTVLFNRGQTWVAMVSGIEQLDF